MDIGYIVTFVLYFIALAGMINLTNNKKCISVGLTIKGISYFCLAFVIFVSVWLDKSADRYITGLTLGIAIIEGSSAVKDGIKKKKI